jgi:hypothetical protein
LVEPPRSRVGLDIELKPQRALELLVLPQRELALARARVETHQADVCSLAERIAREDSVQRLDRGDEFATLVLELRELAKQVDVRPP